MLMFAAWPACSAVAGRMPAPPRVVIHEDSSCPDAPPDNSFSCADQTTDEIWLAPGAGRFERWHEIGHLFDGQVLTDADRAWFKAHLGFPASTPWTGNEAAWAEVGGDAVPAEHFADAYAMCVLGRSPAGKRGRDGRLEVDWVDVHGYLPTVRQHRRVCNAIAIVGLIAEGRR